MRVHKTFIFFVILTAVIGSKLVAQWSNNPKLNTPICTEKGDQYGIILVEAKSNGAYMVWMDERNGNPDIYAQKIDSSGLLQWQTNGIPICQANGSQGSIQAVIDKDENLIVTWFDNRSAKTQLFGQKVSPVGNIFWNEDGIAFVDSIKGNYQYYSICSDRNDGIFIFWADCRVYLDVSDLYAQHINSEGKRLWQNDGIVVSNATSSQFRPIAMNDGFNGAIVVWNDTRNWSVGNIWDIYAQRIDSNGNSLWTFNGIPICAQPRDQTGQKIIAATNNEFIISWGDERTPGSDTWENYAQKINLSGNISWAENGVQVCPGIYPQASPMLVTDNLGGAILTWTDHRLDVSGRNPRIFAQHLSLLGALIWQNNGIQICSNIAGPSAIVSDDSSGAIIVWNDGRNGNDDIFAQRICRDGTLKWINNGNPICTAPNSQNSAMMIKGGNGSAIVVWCDNRNTSIDIYAQKILRDGTLPSPSPPLDNTKPNPPSLISPTDNSYINSAKPKLSWLVPQDADGDQLHFKVEIATDNNFNSPISGSPFESNKSTVGFRPFPPVAQGSDSCSFTLQSALSEGTYYWRISAWDGKAYGDPSEIRKITIDLSKPYTSSHNPSKNSSGVSVNTNIVVHVQDALSGVKQSSLTMKVNGSAVPPTITGTSSDYKLAYNPDPDFGYNRTINVSVEAEDNAGNKMTTDSYSFSTVSDLEPPYTANHNPSKNAQEVPRNTNIVVHVLDNVSGVNQSSIEMKVKSTQVTPTITGTSPDYTLTYDPPIDFNYQETITVTIIAMDIAGNPMNTDSYSFTTVRDIPPDPPSLISPSANSYLNDTTPQLSWSVPIDANGDQLHFKVEIDNDHNWSNIFRVIESKTSTTGFSPTPPVNQGTGSMSYIIQSSLSEGEWWWRVAAWDGKVYGSYSAERKFTVDVTKPYSSNHNPAKNATGVAINSNIVVDIQDVISGVNQSSILMKVNGDTVSSTITGTVSNYTLTYNPANDFNYNQTVTVSIDAEDNAENKMSTDNYSFTTGDRPPINLPPDPPILSSPTNNSYTNDASPQLNWLVPQDANGDQLHFKVEIATDNNFNSPISGSPFESNNSAVGFSPIPPVTQGSGSCSYTIQSALNEGTYYWRVSAWDGKAYGDPSEIRKITIDLSKPYTSSHNPSKNAKEVPRNTNILVHILDAVSGVDQSSIIMKVKGVLVTPSITGDSSEYSLTYNPPTDFDSLETVNVSIDARDIASNQMNTDNYSFTIGGGNIPPESPVLISPSADSYLNDTTPLLSWFVPVDSNRDQLHFKVEIDNDHNWINIFRTIESKTSTTGFSPTPPVNQGTGSMSNVVQSSLSEGDWWWRVAAWDGQVYGGYSDERKFTVDITKPFTSNHNPVKNATGIAINTNIIIHILDAISGVDSSSILIKVKGAKVKPNVCGSPSNFTLTYDPLNNFNYEETITVIIDAKDIAGNQMKTDTTSFMTTSDTTNIPPDPPILIFPSANSYINDNTPQLSWSVPTDANGDQLHFKVEIDDDHNWSNIFRTIESKTSTTGFSPIPPVNQGTGSMSYVVQSSLSEGNWWWRVAAWDGQVYSSYSSERKLIVDITKPYTSNHNPAKNATGVAINSNVVVNIQDVLSGVNQSSIVMKVNSNTVSPTITGTVSNYTLTYNPENDFNYNQTVIISIDAVDNAENKMSTDNYSFTTGDNVPPSPPILSSPANNSYTNDATPQLNWLVPQDANGDLLHFKVEVSLNSNFSNPISGSPFESKNVTVGFSPIPPVVQGNGSCSYTLQAALNNGAYYWRVSAWDSHVYGTASNIYQLKIDMSGPQISHSVIDTANASQSLTISATITDYFGVAEATVYYRQGGEVNFHYIAMNNASGDTYLATIPASIINERGLEYYISAKDYLDNTTTFPNNNPIFDPQVIQVRSFDLTFSTSAKLYQIISIPIDLYNPAPLEVLKNNLGPYKDTKWRLFRYIKGDCTEYKPDKTFDTFDPGKGFWLITKDVEQIDTGTGVSVSTEQNYPITLYPGWNQIGNPFAFSVNWSDVVKNNGIEDRLVGYKSGTGYADSDTLVPWEGYFVKNRNSNSTIIEIPPKEASISLNKQTTHVLEMHNFQNNEWGVQITAQCSHYLDKDNYFGCLHEACDDWDNYDFSEPPFFAECVSLYFPHEDWKIYPGFYTSDFRSVKLEGEYWNFCVKTNVLNSEILLNLQDIQNLPSDWSVLLLDNTSQLTIDFLEQKKYTFYMNRAEDVHEFRIFVGAKKFIDKNNLKVTEIPERYELTQNYPNPFNSETQIRYFIPISGWVNLSVYSIIGQNIRSLVDSYQGAGFYNISWDGRSESGNTVTSGIYLIKIESGRFIKTQKMILAK